VVLRRGLLSSRRNRHAPAGKSRKFAQAGAPDCEAIATYGQTDFDALNSQQVPPKGGNAAIGPEPCFLTAEPRRVRKQNLLKYFATIAPERDLIHSDILSKRNWRASVQTQLEGPAVPRCRLSQQIHHAPNRETIWMLEAGYTLPWMAAKWSLAMIETILTVLSESLKALDDE
jgi:hypothetical protein